MMCQGHRANAGSLGSRSASFAPRFSHSCRHHREGGRQSSLLALPPWNAKTPGHIPLLLLLRHVVSSFIAHLLPFADAFITPTKPKASKIWPKRESLNNAFLVDSSEKGTPRSGWDGSGEEEEVVGEARVREGTPTPSFWEKLTITYAL
ncbi:hypothetical protein HD554DRAFT_1714057 [Boletus coccyginus]|nr:hypothetical protein HD554DRAFT_1714057 [Boletus coccyginus]